MAVVTLGGDEVAGGTATESWWTDSRQAIIESRCCGGPTIDETAEVVGLTVATVVREWTIAKA
jgi:hypothetical protein